MNILFVITGLGMGGAENLVVNLADKYKAMGHKVTIVYAFGEKIVSPNDKDIEILSLGVNNYFDFVKAIFRLMRIINKVKPDVIHSHMIHANLLARLTRMFNRKPALICTAHSTNEGGKLRMFAYRLTDFLADITTNVSQEAADVFVSLGAVPRNKIVSVPNGIDTQKFVFNYDKRVFYRQTFDISSDDKLIVAVGSLNPPKDYPNLLNAIRNIKSKKKNIKVIIVGDGPLKDDLIFQSCELGIADIVNFIGINRDVSGIMSAGDLFVLSSSFEGFGLVVAEAMACQRAIVATDCGGVREVVGDTGILVPPKNSQLLADAIITQLNRSEDELNVQGATSRIRVVNHFSLNRTAEQYLELYNKYIK
ncbi:glycosyltransferase [Photobacterium damselae]|uniref:glycosyltransferase n=1 Tax=Photobacterium damselae TaxID=38293 RepID=UPI003D7D2DF3